MTNVRIEFENLYCVTPDEMKKGKNKTGYEHVNVNMAFDIKIDGKFTRKAVLVDYGYKTALPS